METFTRGRSLRRWVAGAAVGLLALVGGLVASTTTSHAQDGRYEAERSPAVCDGTVDTNHSGYSGSGFCNTPNAIGSAVAFTFNAPQAGAATLVIGYANGGGDTRPADVQVNGSTARSAVGFADTGAWNAWSRTTVTVPVNAGSNTVRLVATTASGLANIDYLDVSTGGDPAQGDRPMEDLDRGVVAVRNGGNVLVSWRLLGLDPDGIGFNVYRSAGGGSEVKLNSSPLTGGTNYLDRAANLSQSNTYRVAPVVGGVEQERSPGFTLTANHADEPAVRIPLRAGGPINFTWVGDLDGDGAYDYVVDRQTSPQKIEAYSSKGVFLWEVNMGHNSTNQNNIEGGSSTIDVGHNDGVTVYDFDSDGRAEVAVRIANGVTFGNGARFNHSNDTEQFIAVLDGRTGALRSSAKVPTDYLSDGPMYARFAACHLDGKTPSLVAYMKNRIGNGGFNLMVTAWSFDGGNVNMQWKWLRGNGNHPDGHNSRCLDVDGNGTDEFVEIGFVLNGDGTLKYSLGSQGIIHGDRFHIADIDPSRPGLEGYGVQQDHSGGLREYYYAAATGQMIWKHTRSGTADVGRGMAGDIDPRHPGMEVWSFDGLYNAATNRLAEPDSSLQPWPQMGLWWDGDITMELFNSGKIEKWDPNNPTSTSSVPRLEHTGNYGGVLGPRSQPTLLADVFGDWREEVVLPNSRYDQLIIYTTDRPSDIRLYTLAHNPAYRNDMTVKGYMQSHHVDYFLGAGMSAPPRPDITY
ncbi:carbohydrate-binding protein [Glycomyces sp. YM15]|uniref:rhamnogalacturonan lyase family protein n=1 Tax=Glycomyces sp. YM15 TaxID=2800446 RepID=UPI001965E52B|nr:carbohydrate-binding protein [Glycomyces sp. YM15]